MRSIRGTRWRHVGKLNIAGLYFEAKERRVSGYRVSKAS